MLVQKGHVGSLVNTYHQFSLFFFVFLFLNQNVTICYDSDPRRPSCRVLCSHSLDKQLPKICPIGSH